MRPVYIPVLKYNHIRGESNTKWTLIGQLVQVFSQMPDQKISFLFPFFLIVEAIRYNSGFCLP